MVPRGRAARGEREEEEREPAGEGPDRRGLPHEPDPARVAAYDRIYGDYYAQLYPLLRPLLVSLGRGVLAGEWGGGGEQ